MIKNDEYRADGGYVRTCHIPVTQRQNIRRTFFMIGQKNPDESGAQQTRHVETMMFLCWASVADAGPT